MSMKRTWIKVIIAMMTMVLLGIGTAGAGMFPDQDAKMAAARAKSLEADRRAAAQKTVIVLDVGINRVVHSSCG